MPPTNTTTYSPALSGNEDAASGEQEESLAAESEGDARNQLFSVEGIMMLMVAIIFDATGLLCAFLIWAFGVGAVLGRIVSAGGLAVFTIWGAMRGGGSGQQEVGELQEMAKKTFQRFLKKHWKKLSVEACPVLGDIAPTFIMMWYSELK